MAWQTPKTDWTPADGVADVDFNRIEGNIVHLAAQAPSGYLFGLTLSNTVADLNNDIDIAAGEARDSGNSVTLVLASALTKRSDAAWAAGSGNGGMDTGTKPVSSTLHVWLIRRPDTGVVDALFSISATNPTMPTNYNQRRRIGSVLTDGSGNIRRFMQRDDRFLLSTVVTDLAVLDQGTTSVLRTLTVPNGIYVVALMYIWVFHSSQASAMLITSPDLTDEAATYGRCNSHSTQIYNGDSHGLIEVETNLTRQVRSVSSHGSTRLTVGTRGWIDTRGRLA